MPSPCLSVFKDGQLPGPGFYARSPQQWGQPWAAELPRALRAEMASHLQGWDLRPTHGPTLVSPSRESRRVQTFREVCLKRAWRSQPCAPSD